MVICLTLYFLRHTNELRKFALTTQQRKFFICSMGGLLLEAARLVVFRLVSVGDEMAWRDVEMAACCWTCEGCV